MFEAFVLYLILSYRFGVTLAGLSYEWLDSKIEQTELRFGPRLWSAMLALVLLVTAAIYCRPAFHTSALGTKYALLATTPFGTAPNPVGLRILTPLISYCLGLRGELIIITNLLFAGLLIFMVYRYFRKVSPRPGDAFIAAATVAFSLVTLTTLYFGGYCDSLTYVIIFLIWRTRSKPVLFYALLFLGFLNRESLAFLIPWFALLTYQGTSNRMRWFLELVVGLSLSVGLYLLFRDWMSTDRAVEYNIGFYLNPVLSNPLTWIKRSVLNWPIGLFSVFKLMWITVAVAAVSLWKSGRRGEVYSWGVLLVCTGMQLVLAYDTSRLMTMAFMAVISALERLFETNPGSFRRWIGWVMLGSLAIPQLYTTAEHILVMQPLLFNLVATHVAAGLN